MEMFEFFLDKPIPATKSKKQKVLWMLEIARASNRKIKSMTFVYDYKIPRISGTIHQLRQDGHDILSHDLSNGSCEYELVATAKEIESMRNLIE